MFPNFLGFILLVCHKAHLDWPKTVEKPSVAICLVKNRIIPVLMKQYNHSERAIFTFATSVCRTRWPGSSDACPLFLVFKILLLPNYCVKYYDYIVKWCSGIARDWCVSLDIALILVLMSQQLTDQFFLPQIITFARILVFFLKGIKRQSSVWYQLFLCGRLSYHVVNLFLKWTNCSFVYRGLVLNWHQPWFYIRPNGVVATLPVLHYHLTTIII